MGHCNGIVKCADLSGIRLPLITISKNNISEIHISEGPEWVFPSLPYYGSWCHLKINPLMAVMERSQNNRETLLPDLVLLQMIICVIKEIFDPSPELIMWYLGSVIDS